MGYLVCLKMAYTKSSGRGVEFDVYILLDSRHLEKLYQEQTVERVSSALASRSTTYLGLT